MYVALYQKCVRHQAMTCLLRAIFTACVAGWPARHHGLALSPRCVCALSLLGTYTQGTMTSPPAGASCWVCLEEGPDEDSGLPLMRNCACRGSAGWAHARCVGEYAERKATKAYKDYCHGKVPPSDGTFLTAWTRCFNCKCRYEGEMMCSLIKIQVVKAEALPKGDCQRLFARLFALHRHAECVVLHENRDAPAAWTLLQELFSDIQVAKSTLFVPEDGINPARYERMIVDIEFKVLFSLLGICSTATSGRKTPSEAMKSWHQIYYQSALELTSRFPPESPFRRQIHFFRPTHKDHNTLDVEGLMFHLDGLIRENGWNNETTLSHSGLCGQELIKSGRVVEALELMRKAIVIAERKLGLHHNTTKQIESIMAKCEEKLIRATLKVNNPEMNGKVVIVQFAGKGNNADKYVCSEEDNLSKKFRVQRNKLRLENGTSVECHGLNSAKHLNDKRGTIQTFKEDSGRYEIKFEESGVAPCLVKPDNLKVVFK